MTQKNGSDCKYVVIFTHRVGSIGAPSRWTVFIRGTNTKQWQVPKIAGRNTKTKIVQEGNAGFKATTDLARRGDASGLFLRLHTYIHFLDGRLTYSGDVVSLTRRPPFPPGRFLVLISVRGWVDPRVIVRLEGLGQLK
jgi:hypothetical protein